MRASCSYRAMRTWACCVWRCDFVRAGDKTKPISLLLLSPVEEQSNVLRHWYSISFREMAALTEALKELAADNGLKSKVVFCLGLEPFIEPDLQEDNQIC